MSGPETLRFDQWVDRCLYHPEAGFYASGRGRAGRRSDFITSPEVGPLFGAVVARALDRWWDEAGQPGRFPVVDAGSGPGALVRSLQLAAPRCSVAWELRAADVAPGMTADLGDVTGGVVIANELLDNLPFRMLERGDDRGWKEVFVDIVDGKPTERLAPSSDVPALLDRVVSGRVPWLEAAHRWVADALERGPRRLLVLDYGLPTTTALAERGGWLRTYHHHVRGCDPYESPGLLDITTDVPFDQLPRPSMMTVQHLFLREFGIEELVDEGRAYWAAHASAPDLEAMRMRSRLREADALLDPAGLGGWMVATWGSVD